jgi:membrane protein DedA with SNARE-associated domain
MDRVLSLIENYSYLVILFGVMLESTGVPLPGETILLASGVLVHRGHLNLGDVIAFGILGAVLGDQIGYWVGRGGGRTFVLRWGRYVFITPARLGRAEAFFARHGGRAVFLAASSRACGSSVHSSPAQLACPGGSSPFTTSWAEPCGPRLSSRSATFCGPA